MDVDEEEPGQEIVVARSTQYIIPGDPSERSRDFDACWAQLSDKKKKFLVELQKYRFNARATIRSMGAAAPNQTTTSRWPRSDESYRRVLAIMQFEATEGVLSKEHLVLRHNDCVETLLTPKPVLYQGIPVRDTRDPTGNSVLEEVEAGAAAKANETLLRLGGHLRDEQEKASVVGPSLIVQVTSRESGEVVTTTNIGVLPELPQPSWLDE